MTRFGTATWIGVLAACLLAGGPLASAPVAPRSTVAPVARAVLSVSFLEGPAATDGGDLYFSDLAANRIYKRDRAGKLTIFRDSANFANGLAMDAGGALLAAEDGDPATGVPARITRTDLASGTVSVLASGFGGKEFQAPNDIVVDGRGRIYFTDWARPDFLPPMPSAPRNPFAVYRIEAHGILERLLVAPQIEAPNGIMISPDDKILYLVDSNRAVGGRRRISSYVIAHDGTLSAPRLFHDFSPGRSGDGIAIDTLGRLWVAAGLNAPRAGGESMDTRAGVHVFAADGRRIKVIPIDEDLVTNVAFGGPGRRTAYVTAGKTVFEIASDVDGTRR